MVLADVLPINGVEDEDPRYLPAAFWSSRISLRHIRQAALARSACPDAVLHSVIARVIAYGRHTQTIPPTIGSHVAANYFVSICGSPAVGKSINHGIADELITEPFDPECEQRTVGSGQSIAAAYFEEVQEEGSSRKRTWRQVRHNAILYIDEGEMMTTLGRQRDSILLPVLRSAWMGTKCGTSGVKAETTRNLPSMSYRLGLVVNFQPKHAAALFADADSGLPQRFVWVLATYPRQGDRPQWPGALTWTPGPYSAGDFALPDEVKAELLAEHDAIQAGEKVVEELDAHANLLKIKMAVGLAQLEQRQAVNAEDWHLAGMMLDASKAAREDIRRQALEARYAAEGEANEMYADRAVMVDAERKMWPFKVDRAADELVAEAKNGPYQWSGKKGRLQRLAYKQRTLARAAMAQCLEREQLDTYDDNGNLWLRLREASDV